MGVEIHEGPNATPSNDKPLPAGAVISAEPGIYLPGKLGVRIEDVLYLTPEGLSKPHSGPQGAGHSLTPIQSHARRKNPMASYIGASAEQEDADPILMAFAAEAAKGDPASPEARELVLRWQAHLVKFSRSCDEEKLRRLADLYSWDNRFAEVLDSYGPARPTSWARPSRPIWKPCERRRAPAQNRLRPRWRRQFLPFRPPVFRPAGC